MIDKRKLQEVAVSRLHINKTRPQVQLCLDLILVQSIDRMSERRQLHLSSTALATGATTPRMQRIAAPLCVLLISGQEKAFISLKLAPSCCRIYHHIFAHSLLLDLRQGPQRSWTQRPVVRLKILRHAILQDLLHA